MIDEKKLIDRLESKKFYHTTFDGVMPEQIEVVTLGCVKEVANKLAKEYKDKDCSQCSRRSWYQKGYADAKKELAEEYKNDCCEWEYSPSDKDVIKPYHHKDSVGMYVDMLNKYPFCGCCGKKIKVVE